MVLVGRICQGGRMEVSVTGMAEDDYLDIIFLGEFFYPVDKLGDISARHCDIFREYLFGFSEDSGKTGAAGHPILVGVVGIFCDAGFLCAIFLGDLCDLLCFFLNNLRNPINLKEQTCIGILRQTDGHHLFDPVNNPVIDHFDLAGDNTVLEHAEHAFAGDRDIVIDNAKRLSCLGQGVQFQLGRGDDTECSFSADEDMKQVVADNVLQCPAAEVDDFAGGQNRFDTQDILFGHSILYAGGTTGILGYDPTHGGAQKALGIGREEKTVLHEPEGKVLKDNAWFHRGGQVFLVDLDNLIKPRHDHNDAAMPGNGSAADICAAAPGGNGYLFCIRQFHYPGYFVCSRRKDNDIRFMDPACRPIVGIRFHRLRCSEDIVFTDNLL